MTIVTLGSKYFIPIENGFKEISYVEAMDLYESGLVEHEEVLDYEVD
jgi:hypothetical protein